MKRIGLFVLSLVLGVLACGVPLECEKYTYANTIVLDYPLIVYDGEEFVPYGGGEVNRDMMVELLERRVDLFEKCVILDKGYEGDLEAFRLQLEHFGHPGETR